MLMLKINFKNKKKYYFNIFLNKNTLKLKQPLPQYQTSYSSIIICYVFSITGTRICLFCLLFLFGVKYFLIKNILK